MYGFSGYGTNSHGSERQNLLGPVVRLATLVVGNSYNVMKTLMLKFRAITLEL
jgi:hypothetical protein